MDGPPVRAIFVGGPLEGERIGVPEGQPAVVVMRGGADFIAAADGPPIPTTVNYGQYTLVGEGVYRWMGWDHESD